LDSNANSGLNIVPVTGRDDLRQFLRVPYTIYADDPNWIAPLLIERREHLAKKNPYFAHARWQGFIASRNGRPVGRISAQVDELHLDRYDDATGFFGFLDAEDNADTFRTLFEAAENWLAEQGMRRVRGPLSFSTNQETGLLIKGFETPPMAMMGHSLPYHAGRIEANGYSKAKDVIAYRLDPRFATPPAMQRLLDRTRNVIRIRPLDKGNLDRDLEILRDIFNDAWAGNWGFVPFTEAEFRDLGHTLKFLIDEDFVQIAEIEGEPAAMIVSMPNINEAIRDLNGRLLPLGWAKLLWRLKVRYPHTGRVPLMGVRARYHRKTLGAALAYAVIHAVRAPIVERGIHTLELSWILEENKGMRTIIESIGGIAYKTYRVYEKELSPPAR
jgi:hypothetical protein